MHSQEFVGEGIMVMVRKIHADRWWDSKGSQHYFSVLSPPKGEKREKNRGNII
jgi:hypothetical protein